MAFCQNRILFTTRLPELDLFTAASNKSDATGWDGYDTCINVGAMVALAYEHAYSRTPFIRDFNVAAARRIGAGGLIAPT